MKVEDAINFARLYHFEMFNIGNDNYSLYFSGECIGKVYRKNNEFIFEFDGARVADLKR